MTITRMQERVLWLALAGLGTGFLILVATAGFWPFAPDGSLLTLDFSPVWAAGERVLAGEAALVYDLPLHDSFQGALRGVAAADDLPFAYPPSALPLTAPLALFDYGTALVIYLTLGALLFALVLRRITGDTVTAVAMALAIGGPTATLWLGQNGFLTASAIAAGFLLLRRHPLLAGLCFGLLALKPHLAAVALALLFVWREWRALAAAATTIIALALFATLLFGPSIWLDYIEAGKGVVAIVERHEERLLGDMMQSVYAMLALMLGKTPAMAIQLVCAALAFVAAAIVPAERADERAAAAIAATLLATPYSFPYDATMLIAAVAFLVRSTRDARLHLAGAAAVLLIGCWFVVRTSLVPWSAALILALAVARARPLHWRLWEAHGTAR